MQKNVTCICGLVKGDCTIGMKGYFVHAHVNSAAVISSPVTHSKWYTFRGDDINICHTFLFCVFSCLAFLNACSSKRIFLLS